MFRGIGSTLPAPGKDKQNINKKHSRNGNYKTGDKLNVCQKMPRNYYHSITFNFFATKCDYVPCLFLIVQILTSSGVYGLLLIAL